MIKFAGLAALILSCSLMGFSAAARCRKHCAALSAVTEMLARCRIMLKYSLCTVAELVASLMDCRLFRLMEFNMPAEKSQLPDTLAERVGSGGLVLDEEEREKLREFFCNLGTTDLDGQLSSLEYYSAYFSDRYSAVGQESLSKCRLYRSMGILAGVFVAVILI